MFIMLDVTDISHLARTGNIDNSRLIEVVHVHLGSPNINRIPWF